MTLLLLGCRMLGSRSGRECVVFVVSIKPWLWLWL